MFELPKMGYSFDALEPFIDARTMEIHYTKHHQAYTDKFNAALQKHPELFKKTAEEIIRDLSNLPEDIRAAVRNHGGGYVNHKFFWPILKKDVKFGGEIAEAINSRFGSFEKFKEAFASAAAGQFGSGWAWLVIKDGNLEIMSTPNQDSPLTKGMKPLIAIDVWEHAYYLKYQNRRPEYIQNWWNVVNWDAVAERYKNLK